MYQHFENLYDDFAKMNINSYIFMISLLLSISVLASISISYALHIQYAYWAGYTCVRIMTDNKAMTYKRGLLRCIGTLMALLVVLICTSLFKSDIVIISLIVFLLILCVSMAYYFTEYTYFFIMFCITLGLFFYPYAVFSKDMAIAIIIDRSIVTIIGALCVCVIVLPFLKKKNIAKISQRKRTKEHHLEMITFSVFFILTFAFIFLITVPFKNVLLFEQALIGVVAVMSSFEHSQIHHLSLQRFLGCLIGLLVPFVLVLFNLNIVLVLIIAFIIVILFGLIQLQGKYIAYMGAQANLCFLTSIYANNDILQVQAGYQRLLSTVVTLLCIVFVSVLYFSFLRLTKYYINKKTLDN